MALLEILTAPNPLLTKVCRPVREDEFGEELAQRVRDMVETMYEAPGVGLAAPQVGDLRRLLVADPGAEDEDGNPARGPYLCVLVNPVLVEASEERILWEEGCLSLPEFWQEVDRAREIRVAFQDVDGQSHEAVFEEFAAIVIQHEMDHLEGITLVDKGSTFKRTRYFKARKKLRAALESG
jgi:peptide deformylase